MPTKRGTRIPQNGGHPRRGVERVSAVPHSVNPNLRTRSGKATGGGNTLCNIGYTITDAAAAAGVTVRVIEMAINARELVARRVADAPVILYTDMHKWLDAMPNWLD